MALRIGLAVSFLMLQLRKISFSELVRERDIKIKLIEVTDEGSKRTRPKKKCKMLKIVLTVAVVPEKDGIN